MLDARYVADHIAEAQQSLSTRSDEAASSLDAIAGLSAERRTLIAEVEALQAQRNAANKAMAALAKGPDKAAFAARRDELKSLSEQIKELDTKLAAVLTQMEDQLLSAPNLPHESVPVGKNETENVVVRTWGAKPELSFEPKAHWDLGADLGILDFDRSAKLSGARFAVMWGLGARLERALTSFMLDLHTGEHGYTEVYPPFLVRAEALRGTGQLPKFEEDLFKTQRSDPDDPGALYLIPTAEVPVTNLHAQEILDEARLPLAYTAFTPCFRSEAGSYGKDVRGLIRQHQFDKVELVRVCTPDQGLEQLELLTRHAETVLQKLGLHYRVVELCTGDLGFAAAKTYDIEVWLPSQNAYREISSCSWCGDFQARRAQIRFRPGGKKAKPRLAHTLNGSALAVGRTWIAVVEQFQQADGSILVPEVLRAAVGAERITPRV